MEIKAIRMFDGGFMNQPSAFGGEEDKDMFDEMDGLYYMMHGDVTYCDAALKANKLSIIFEDKDAARETLDRVCLYPAEPHRLSLHALPRGVRES